MLLANKYKVEAKIGQGTFGTVFLGENIRTGEPVAIKMEPNEYSSLKNEARVLQYLQGCEGFPTIKWFGLHKSQQALPCYYTVMQLLDKSLNDLLLANHRIPLPKVCLLGMQMFKRVETLHKKFLIHRDIKPDNFLLGANSAQDKEILYLIDFGFCKRYMDDFGNHVKARENNNSLIGTPAFVSLNVQMGYEPSRRDDIESVVFVMMQLYYGALPWTLKQNSAAVKHNSDTMKDMKTIGALKEMKLHTCFFDLLENVRLLQYEDEPFYEFYYEVCTRYLS